MEEKYFFNQQFDFSKIIGKGKIISSSIGPGNEAVLLVVSPQDEKISQGHEKRGLAIFPLTMARQHYSATFFRLNSNEILQKAELAKIEVAFPLVQPMPNEEILVVGSRCNYRNGNPEKNAIVFDRAGKVLRHFVLGDGINDIQTTNDGLIWVSYFDEGVFGNFGWNEPMGSAGLNCFNSKGHNVWQFEPPNGFDSICDCYALNVAQDAVWISYYTDFPLLKINPDRQVKGWKNEIRGASAMAVNNNFVLLWGGYGDERTRCVLQSFGDEILMGSRPISLNLPNGFDVKGARIVGRGSIFHAFTDKKWFAFDINVLGA